MGPSAVVSGVIEGQVWAWAVIPPLVQSFLLEKGCFILLALLHHAVPGYHVINAQCSALNDYNMICRLSATSDEQFNAVSATSKETILV